MPWTLDYGVWILFYRQWGEKFPVGDDIITVVDKYSSNSNGA